MDDGLGRWIDDLRVRLHHGDLAGIGTVDVRDGTGSLPGETVIDVIAGRR
jgi:hypothetical protein